MLQGWKQIWHDIKGALGLSTIDADTESEQVSVLSEADGDDTPDLVTDLPASASPPPTGLAEVAVDSEAEAVFDETLAEAESFDAMPEDEIEAAMEAESPAAPSRSNWVTRALVIAGLAGAIGWSIFRSNPKPPAPNVVATFNGGQITIEEVQEHLALLAPDEFSRLQLETPQGYLAVIDDLVVEALVRRWADERQVDGEEEFQHTIEHITEAITVDDLHGQVHDTDIRIEESEIRAYYEANRNLYGERLYGEVRDEIRQFLVSQNEGDYLADYLAQLRENASVTADYSLLDVPAPTEDQLQQYYKDQQAEFVRPAVHIVDEIRLRASDDEASAEAQINEALTRLRTGEEWASVVADVSIDPYFEGGFPVLAGTRPAPYDEIVAALGENQVSESFRAGDFYYIARLNSRTPEQVLTFDLARPLIVNAVQVETEAGWFAQVGERTLFTLHSRRFTAGEFYREYQELPPEARFQFSGSDGMRQLADQLIDRLLLAEDASDRLLETENEAEIEEVRLDILQQMQHQEEVDDKIEITDEEMRAYYDVLRTELVAPPQARISYIRIGLGQTEDDRQRAEAKANEAYDKVAPSGLFGGGQGLDFAEMAGEYSEDPETAAKGGEMPGWVGESYDLISELTDHPFHAQFLNLPLDSITQPFEYQGSLYIVKVREKREAQPLAFEEAESFIREELTHQKHDALTEEFTHQMIDQAQLVVYEDVLRDFFASTANVP